MVSSSCSRPVVLITGAASGIGAATARLCASRNWIVYATDTDTQFPPAVEADCRCHELDVTDAAQCKAVVDRILDETGRIDVLVNNAGFAVPGPIEDVSVADSRFQFDVVVHGSHRMTQTVLPAMRARGEGRILMLSSVLGVSPSPGLGSYGAAKAALESLTDSLRMELRGTGISVSLIEPAWVDTSFAERARDRLKNVQPAGERAAAYSDTYAMVESGWALTGGPFALSPETVAETVVKAATDDNPKARYPVGTRSRLVMAGGSCRTDSARRSRRRCFVARLVWTPFGLVASNPLHRRTRRHSRRVRRSRCRSKPRRRSPASSCRHRGPSTDCFPTSWCRFGSRQPGRQCCCCLSSITESTPARSSRTTRSGSWFRPFLIRRGRCR